MSRALKDVKSERRRQVDVEGWSHEHDDEHKPGQLALAASCYAAVTSTLLNGVPSLYEGDCPPPNWPWHTDWWKVRDCRRNLVRAAALIVAEIERFDRASKLNENPLKPEVK